MGRLFGKKGKTRQEFNRQEKQPVLHASICTGEKVAGFRDRATGKLEEVMLITSDSDLREFMDQYGIEEGELKKEW